jgi:arylsulfatase
MPTTVIVSLAAAVLVWIGLGYLGRRYLARYVPTVKRPLILNMLAAAAFLTVVGTAALNAMESPKTTARAAASAQTPNVVLIVVDALRPDHLSTYDYHRVTSPNLDRFAAGAAVFENAYSHGNRVDVALPSLHTSVYPSFLRSGDRVVPTIADLCRKVGSTTVCVTGKAMLDAVPSTARGFDFVDGFDTVRYDLSVYRAVAHLGLIRPPTHPPNSPNAEAVTDRGIEWLRRVEDRPLFLFLNYEDLLPPYAPPRDYETAFSPDESVVDDRLLFTKTAAMANGSAPVRLKDGELERLVDLYDETVRYVDDEIGRFLSELEMAGLKRNTTIIFTADRGMEFMEHGSLYNSELATEETIRVPLMIGRVPEGGPGRSVGGVVRHVDVLPTVAALLETETPDGIHGSSLAPLLSGARKSGSLTSVAEGKGCLSVNTGRWKMMHVEEMDAYYLYDLSVDRLGRKDVSGTYARQSAEMKALVDEYFDLRAGIPVIEGKLMTGDVTR